MDTTKLAFTDQQLSTWIDRCQEMINKHFLQNASNLPIPTLVVAPGNRFIKILKCSGRRTEIFAFIDQNGDVLKPASYKKPAKHARGNLNDAQKGMGSMSWLGPAYLRM